MSRGQGIAATSFPIRSMEISCWSVIRSFALVNSLVSGFATIPRLKTGLPAEPAEKSQGAMFLPATQSGGAGVWNWCDEIDQIPAAAM